MSGDIILDPSQERAVELLLDAPLGCVTGGPGTGKTTILRAALDRLDALGRTSYALAAPTGKAARRMSEATGRPAKTVHRLLEYGPGPTGAMGFQRNRENPLGCELVVVDEASMLDLELAAALLSAVDASRTRLVLVGDANQLPSVGPGRVFGDLLASSGVEAAVLTHVHRAAAASWYCTQAPRVLAGETPDLERRPDFVWVEEPDRARALGEAVRWAERLSAEHETQALIPQRIGPAGSLVGNDLLRRRLNPSPAGVWKLGEVELGVGDRVIHTRNDYWLGVMNGETGVVEALRREPAICDACSGTGRVERERCSRCAGRGQRGPCVAVRYPADDPRSTRLVEYGPEAAAKALEHSYALTVHKAQGSQWPWVVVLCHSTHSRMLTRQLLYTAITRSSRGVVLVGDRAGLERAVKEDRDGRRNTALAERIRKEAA